MYVLKPRIRCVENTNVDVIIAIVIKIGRNQNLFLYGACWNLYEHLHSKFATSEAWYDPIDGHIYTKIDGIFYDARGSHVNPPVKCKLDVNHRKAISQMRRSAIKTLSTAT